MSNPNSNDLALYDQKYSDVHRTREAIVEEFHSRHPPREPRKSENPTRETAEQITIRLLKGTLGALLDHLRADLEPVWTSMDPQELGKLKASLQLAAIAANGVLSRLEMPV